MSATRYMVPGARHRVEDEIRRSRFITTLDRAASVADAQALIRGVREEFPDATHNCWAFVAGPPGSTAQVGSSDDGEPHGTAGRPMLHALLHSGVGEVVAVVTRYYGGTNLGTGGLVRAYSGGVIHALEGLARIERIDAATVEIEIPYGRFSALERVLPTFEATIAHREFGATARLAVRLPAESVETFRQAVSDISNGQARVVPASPGRFE